MSDSVIDHRRRQNVVRTSVTHSATPRVPLFCSYHILTSSVIYYWTDARQHGIYLLTIYCISEITLEAVKLFFYIVKFLTHPPVSVFLRDGVGGREVYFFRFSWFIFRVFGCGNKLLSWPITNCVVDVWFAETIISLHRKNVLKYIFLHISKRKVRRVKRTF